MDSELNMAPLSKAPTQFRVVINIDDQYQNFMMGAYNAMSAMALLSSLVAVQMPRVKEWVLFDETGQEVLAAAPWMDFFPKVCAGTILGKLPADPKKAAGWTTVPKVTGTTEDFQKMVEKARQEREKQA